MNQNEVFTVAETASFIGVTPNTVYVDVRKNVLHPCGEYPKSFNYRAVTDYKIEKKDLFLDRMEEFRGRTGVSTAALAFSLGVDPSSFSNWKRGVSLPQGDTMLKANQMLNGFDHEVVQRVIDKFSDSKLDMHGVAMLDKLTGVFRRLPVNGNGKSNITIEAERTFARDLTEKAAAVEAEKGQPKRKKREHTSNVLNFTMRSDITDWMHREGKSNSYVARMIGVKSPGVVAGWLKGKHINMPNLEKVETMCRDQQITMGEGYQPALPPIAQDGVPDTSEYDVDDDVEDGCISEEQEASFIRTQELALDLFEARGRVRIAQRELEAHLEGELKKPF